MYITAVKTSHFRYEISFLLRTLLGENLHQKAVQFKDIIYGKFQTNKINEVNSTVTKSATVKCILIIGWNST
jgi:hypothetical protein